MRLYHSNSQAAVDGGAGHDGLGGRVSSDEVISLNVRYNLFGVTLSRISNYNGAGMGALWYTAGSPAKLAWQAPRDVSKGADVNIPTDGTYTLISDGGAWISVNVVVADLPLASAKENVNISIAKNTLFPDI